MSSLTPLSVRLGRAPAGLLSTARFVTQSNRKAALRGVPGGVA
ncbi:hypothetical protein BN2537_9447 [Streptomyces venezuelae]|nr:hypothetical protein BN2537_9447 [Streptomyces venezuelae]